MTTELYEIDPARLSLGCKQAHHACQWASKAARANIAPRPDDSHSNFGWLPDIRTLVSEPLDSNRSYQAGFSFLTGELVWLQHGQISSSLSIENQEDSVLESWLDDQLSSASLVATHNAEMPYSLGDGIRYQECRAEWVVLGRWFDVGFKVLSEIRDEYAGRTHTASMPRCWPHHFDIGSLLLLEDADPETARSVGIGLSPGDSSYGEPYYYCNPWPVPDEDKLGSPPNGLRWHTDGFTSLIVIASELRDSVDHVSTVRSAVERCITLIN